MKNIIITTIIVITVGLTGLFIAARPQAVKQPKLKEVKTNHSGAEQNTANLRQAVLKIDGMFCASCATGAKYVLKEKMGVVDASVDYNTGRGNVVYDPSKISKDEIIQALKPYTAVITEDKQLNPKG